MIYTISLGVVCGAIMNVSIISNFGFLLLAIWLIVSGTLTALSIGNQVISVILGIVAIVAGVLIIIGK